MSREENSKDGNQGSSKEGSVVEDLSFASWRNHIIHTSVYAALIAYCWRLLERLFNSSDSKVASVWIVLYGIVSVLSLLCLQGEIGYMIRRRKMPPGDSGLPLVGHFLDILRDKEDFYIRRIRKYGPINTYNVLMTPVLLLTDEEDVRWAMTQERKGKTTASTLPHMKQLLGEESIMVKSGEQHKRLRKAFEPAFTPTAIRDYAATMDAVAQTKLAQWSASGEFQQAREWALLAMRIFFICAFGEADDEKLDGLAHLFEKWVKGFAAPIPFRFPGTVLSKAHGYKEELGIVLKEMIDDFKEKNPPGSDAAKKSVLGRLCYTVDEDGNMPNDKVLVDNLRLFMFAGYDTTKASFGGISHYLKQNPKLEELLREEVQKFRGDVLDVDQLKNEAPLLNAVMAECWRLAPPLTNHVTTASDDMQYKGYHVPKGAFVVTDIQGHAQMNDGLYPQAENFHFERWLPKDHPLYDPSKANTVDIDYNVMSSKFRTFNHGPHMCLGAHFAKLEVRIVLTRLLQSYDIEIRNERLELFPLKQHLNDFRVSERHS